MIGEIVHSVIHNWTLEWKVEQKIVMYAHLSVLHFSCSTFKCVYITLFHSTCQQTVLHWICSTEFPFDPPTQSVTYNLVWL